MKRVILKLVSVQYTGQSVGEEIHIEIKVRDKFYSSDKIIKPNTTLPIDEPIIEFEIPSETFEENVNIKIVEDDLIFDDVGDTNGTIQVDSNKTEPQEFKFEVKVQEMRTTLRKATAIFIVTLEANQVKRIPAVDSPKWTGNFNDDTETIILSRLIFGEASGEPHEAKEWVAWSVINRMEAKSWWPKTIHEVVLQKEQYDPFKPTDLNYPKIIDPFNFSGSNKITKKSWYECCKIAETVILRKTANPTKATHFHGVGVTKKWYEKNIVPHGKFIKKIGKTYFYWSPN